MPLYLREMNFVFIIVPKSFIFEKVIYICICMTRSYIHPLILKASSSFSWNEWRVYPKSPNNWTEIAWGLRQLSENSRPWWKYQHQHTGDSPAKEVSAAAALLLKIGSTPYPQICFMPRVPFHSTSLLVKHSFDIYVKGVKDSVAAQEGSPRRFRESLDESLGYMSLRRAALGDENASSDQTALNGGGGWHSERACPVGTWSAGIYLVYALLGYYSLERLHPSVLLTFATCISMGIKLGISPVFTKTFLV